MYIKAGNGWPQNEYEILNANNKLNYIRDNTPLNKNDDFKKNNYYLYYKPYTVWTRDC